MWPQGALKFSRSIYMFTLSPAHPHRTLSTLPRTPLGTLNLSIGTHLSGSVQRLSKDVLIQ